MPNFWLLQVRQNIRDKYGIEKKQPTSKSDKQKAAMMEELKKEYGLDDEDAKELEDKMKKVWSLKQNLSSLPPYNFFFRMLLSAMQPRRKLSRRWRWRWDTTRAWSLIILHIQGAEDEERAEEGPWSGQMQAAMISEGLSRPAVTCAKWSNLVCSNFKLEAVCLNRIRVVFEVQRRLDQTYCSAIALKNYVIVDHCIGST